MEEARLLRAKDLAARQLGRRMRSERELETYLERKGYGRKIIHRLIADFRRVGLLDDRALARDWAERRLERMPSGRAALHRTLRARGIEERTVSEILDEVYSAESEAELCRRAAAGVLPRLDRLPTEKRRRRLYGFLAQRGFSRDTVCEFLEEWDG